MLKKQDRLYKKLTSRIEKFGELIEDESNGDKYVLDLVDGYLFYYTESGKVLKKTRSEPHFKTIFREKNDCWVLVSELIELLKETLKNDEI